MIRINNIFILFHKIIICIDIIFSINNQMHIDLTSSQKIHIYLSTLIVFASFMMTLGIISRIKTPLSQQFGLSETFLGLLDGVSFLGSLLGYLTIATYPIKKPVMGTFIMSILLILSMESLILANLTITFRSILLICSRFCCGFFRTYSTLPYIIVNHYFKELNSNNLIQIWYSLGMFGDIIGVIIPDYLLINLGLSWQITMTGTLLLLLISSIYLLVCIQEISQNENNVGLNQMVNFMRQYWSNKLNLIHSLLFVLSEQLNNAQILPEIFIFHLFRNIINYVMILWLPYFFISIGYKQAAFISIAYPLAYIIAGIIFIYAQNIFKSYLGYMFLVFLLIDNLGAIWLTQLGDDSQEIIIYLILIFTTSILTSGYSIFTQSFDLNNRVNSNTQNLAIIFPVNAGFVMILYIVEMLILGALMQKNLHNLFTIYAMMIGVCTVLHCIRLIKYPTSFEDNRDIEEYNNEQEEN